MPYLAVLLLDLVFIRSSIAEDRRWGASEGRLASTKCKCITVSRQRNGLGTTKVK
jgi:hypothetical protein